MGEREREAVLCLTGEPRCSMRQPRRWCVWPRPWLGGRRPSSRHGSPPRATRESRRSEEHTSELQSRLHLVCRLLLEKKKKNKLNQTDRTTITHFASHYDDRYVTYERKYA